LARIYTYIINKNEQTKISRQENSCRWNETKFGMAY